MKANESFSNGSEFAIWQDSWCNECKRDERARDGDYEHGCPILASALVGDDREIPEWSVDPERDNGPWPNVICSAYEPETGGEDE